MAATRTITLIVAEYSDGLAHAEIVEPATLHERMAQIAACADFDYGNGNALLTITLEVPADAMITLTDVAQPDLDKVEDRIWEIWDSEDNT